MEERERRRKTPILFQCPFPSRAMQCRAMPSFFAERGSRYIKTLCRGGGGFDGDALWCLVGTAAHMLRFFHRGFAFVPNRHFAVDFLPSRFTSPAPHHQHHQSQNGHLYPLSPQSAHPWVAATHQWRWYAHALFWHSLEQYFVRLHRLHLANCLVNSSHFPHW